MKPIIFIGHAAAYALIVATLTLGSAHASEAASASVNVSTAASTNGSEFDAASVSGEADKAWKAVKKANQQPATPIAWKTNKPSPEVLKEFYTNTLFKGVDAARDFYTRYPNDKNASAARALEINHLTVLVEQFDVTNVSDRLDSLAESAANSPNATKKDKLRLRVREVQKLIAKGPSGKNDLETAGHELVKDYPDDDVGYQVLMMVLQGSTGDKAKQLSRELTGPQVPTKIRERAEAEAATMDRVGKPLDIKFTAVDGRAVDLASMKGRVVLIDFWATWCGPCMAELPHVKDAYAKLHDQGFEIVGISFDEDKDKLEKTLKNKEMTWPQYFDGEGWSNKYGAKYGIHSIPSMWLVNKQGNLCDISARGDLEGRVIQLLAEK